MGKHVRLDFAEKHGTELQAFLYEALLHGYGSESNLTDAVSDDGKTEIAYETGGWRYFDIYYGGEPYSGMSTIFYKGVACWTMVYWGKVYEGVDKESVYDCLMPALMATKPDHPWRGPNDYVAENGLRYKNSWFGGVMAFYGKEKILDPDGKLRLYEADYRGGIVNLR
jgi:hypothetical protein